ASPFVYVPVAIGIAYLLGAPIGFIAAMNETEGAWPARKPPGPGPGPGPGPDPGPKDGNKDRTKDHNKEGQKDEAKEGAKDGKPVEEEGPKPLEPETVPGLIGYWPLDEKGGGGAPGKAKGGLAFVNGAKWVDGRKGMALEFNGKGDHVDFGAGAPLN